jgi:glycosyltransferase involved in cell wall biosynthesis
LIVNTGKPKLSFYTNMPTPYQVDFFDALKDFFELHVIYFTIRESDRQWNLSVSGDYKITVLKNSRIAKLVQKKVSSFHYSYELARIIRNDNSNYVIVNGTYWSPNVLQAISINHAMKKWVAYWSEPVFPVRSKITFRVKQLLLKTVLKKTDCILAIGTNAEVAFRSYGYNEPIYQLPYNINTELFKKSNLEQDKLNRLEEKYKPKGEYLFLSSGSLIHRKGMDVLIKAFNNLEKELNIKLLILGDGVEKENLLKLSHGDHRIVFIGFQEKELIPYWFNLADAFVFASRYDGWGLVINEALAAEKPVIASNAAGAVTDRLNADTALICEPGNVPAFAEAMRRLATDHQFNKDLVNRTRNISIQLSSAYNARKVYDICTNS